MSEIAELVQCPAKSRDEFLASAKKGELDGVVAAYRTFGSVSQTGLWDAELVDALPASFAWVAHNGAGYDQLQPQALLEHQPHPIIATHVPTAVDDATADTGIFLLLGALRNFNTSLVALREGQWRGQPNPALGHDPQGKLVGILGMGGIGRNFARKCRAFGMRVAYHNRRRLSAADEDGAAYLGFDELLGQADVILVSVPLNPHTRHLIGAPEFAKMKDGIVIVNTARGAVIDEAALVEALDRGKVGSAGLDVYEEEPKVHEGLVRNRNVLLLPHMGTWTQETQEKMERWNMGNVRCALEGRFEEMSVIAEHRQAFEKLMAEKKE